MEMMKRNNTLISLRALQQPVKPRYSDLCLLRRLGTGDTISEVQSGNFNLDQVSSLTYLQKSWKMLNSV